MNISDLPLSKVCGGTYVGKYLWIQNEKRNLQLGREEH